MNIDRAAGPSQLVKLASSPLFNPLALSGWLALRVGAVYESLNSPLLSQWKRSTGSQGPGRRSLSSCPGQIVLSVAAPWNTCTGATTELVLLARGRCRSLSLRPYSSAAYRNLEIASLLLARMTMWYCRGRVGENGQKTRCARGSTSRGLCSATDPSAGRRSRYFGFPQRVRRSAFQLCFSLRQLGESAS